MHWRWSLQTWSRSVPPGVAVLFVVPTVTWQLGLEEICVESKLERSGGWSWTRSGRVGWEKIMARTSHQLVAEICLKSVSRWCDEVGSLQVGER